MSVSVCECAKLSFVLKIPLVAGTDAPWCDIRHRRIHFDASSPSKMSQTHSIGKLNQ